MKDYKLKQRNLRASHTLFIFLLFLLEGRLGNNIVLQEESTKKHV